MSSCFTVNRKYACLRYRGAARFAVSVFSLRVAAAVVALPGAARVFVAAQSRAVLLGVSRQLLGRDLGLAREFLYVGSLAPLAVTHHERAKLVMLGDSVASRFGLIGLFNVDFVRTHEQLWPVEVNP